MRGKLFGLVALVSLMGAGQAQIPAKAPPSRGAELAARFGALESVSQISLAPDARKLAYIGQSGEDQVIYVVDLVNWGRPKPIARIEAKLGQLSWCRWASTVRLVCQTHTVVDNSADLPFAQGRFCTGEGVKNVVTLSMMRDRHFAKDYGVLMEDSPIAGLCARSTLVLDENNKVLYTQLGPELTVEPDYDKALAALK